MQGPVIFSRVAKFLCGSVQQNFNPYLVGSFLYSWQYPLQWAVSSTVGSILYSGQLLLLWAITLRVNALSQYTCFLTCALKILFTQLTVINNEMFDVTNEIKHIKEQV